MAGSSENVSVHDQTVHSSLLTVKEHQNMLIDLEPSKYEPFMFPIIVVLKYSPLTIALTKMNNDPLSMISKAYTSTNYIKEECKISFEIHNRTTSISKAHFCNLLGLPQTYDMLNLESISTTALLDMFYQMGYKETLTSVSKIKKPNLPPQWNGLFTLLFKGFLERVTGSDYASKMSMALIYGLYTGQNVNYGSVL